MRILRSVIQILASPVLNTGQQFARNGVVITASHQVPFISWFSPPLMHLLSKVRVKPITPAANGLVAHHNATLRQEQVDIAKAEGQGEIQPDGILNDLRRETETFEEVL
jgi:hypothetical protein